MAARAEIVPTQIAVEGVAQPAQTTGVAADGHKIANNGAVFVECNNTHTAALIFTFQTPRTIHGLDVAERAISVGAAAYKIVGPFNTDDYNQADGMVYLDYDVTNFALQKVRVYRL